MSAYTGYLIRRERLAQNLSQEGLAKGICAVSYLSKIEQGQVEPGQEIIDRLFAALGMGFVRDPELEAEAERQLETFFFLRDATEPYEEQIAFFDQYGERLSHSQFGLSYDVYCLCRKADENLKEETKADFEKLKPFLGCLSPRLKQEALFSLGRKTDDPQKAAEIFEEAARIRPNCVVLSTLANCMSSMGQYGRSMELTEQALALAFEQGNVWVMILSCFRLGTDACNRHEMNLAKRYYDRVMALSRGYRKDYKKHIHYNLGSSYLEMGDKELALVHLRQSSEDKTNHLHNLLLHQKLAIAYALMNERKAARREIGRARHFLEKAEQMNIAGGSLLGPMIRFAELLAETHGEETPEYEETLRLLYAQTMDAFGHGFRLFYGRFLVALLKGQRRYKEALQIQEEMGFPGMTK